jgi:MFS family permease
MLAKALTHRPFAALLAGQTLSRLGDALYLLAVSWWLVEHTGSPAAVGRLYTLAMVPTALLLLVGGVVVDRWPKLRIMLISDVLCGGIVAVVTWLACTARLEVWHLYVASVGFGIAEAFFMPAYRSLVPVIVPAPQLGSANALTSISSQIGRIGGPPLAAVIVAWGGAGLAFGVNAASFMIAALCVWAVLRWTARVATEGGGSSEGTGTVAEVAPQASLWGELAAGWRVVTERPWLWLATLNSALGNITLAGPYCVALPFLVSDVVQLGWLYAAFPIGYFVAALVGGRYERLPHRWLALGLGPLLAGLGMLVIGLPIGMGWKLLAACINGAALEWCGLAWTSLLQEHVPQDKLGRVTSIDEFGSLALVPVGYTLAGWSTETYGAAPTCVVGGILTMLCCLPLLLTNKQTAVEG